jgi:hypothetical protein
VNLKNCYGRVNVEQAKNTKFEVFIRILNFLIVSEKDIYSKIQKKDGEEAGKKDIRHKKLKKKGIQERNGKREN